MDEWVMGKNHLRKDKMEPKETKAEVFWMAFKSLSKRERQSVVERLLKDEEFAEDLKDLAILEQRVEEPSRSLADYLRERQDKRK